MKLFHDDIRRPPDASWTWARTNEEAKQHLQTGDVEVASLDHDMGHHDQDPDAPGAVMLRGNSEENGVKLVQWMIDNRIVPEEIIIHSHNPVGAQKMMEMLCRSDPPGLARVAVIPFRVEEPKKESFADRVAAIQVAHGAREGARNEMFLREQRAAQNKVPKPKNDKLL